MTLGEAMSVIGVLFGLVVTLVAYIWKRKDQDDVKQEQWRKEVVETIAAGNKRQEDWRHEILSPQLRQHGADIAKVEARLDAADSRLERVESDIRDLQRGNR